MLASNGDVIALLGTAQQELSIRRRYHLQHALPKDVASLCSNENISITDKPFDDDTDKAIKTATDFQNQKLSLMRPAAPPLQTRTKQASPPPFFFKDSPPPPSLPAVQSAGELQQLQGAGKVRGKKLITDSKKSER